MLRSISRHSIRIAGHKQCFDPDRFTNGNRSAYATSALSQIDVSNKEVWICGCSEIDSRFRVDNRSNDFVSIVLYDISDVLGYQRIIL